MSGPLPPPSPTGVRVAGDDYQWLHAWIGCLQVLSDAERPPSNPVVAVGVETGDGNVDDVVLYRQAPPHTYIQVKYAVDSTTPLTTEYLTRPSDSGGPSILNRIARTWNTLIADGTPADLAVVTNRLPDPADVLLGDRDARTGYLMPRSGAGGPRSERGRARAVWAASADIDDLQLQALMSALRFDYGRDLAGLVQAAGLRMLVEGLRGDAAAVYAGADWVAAQVKNGHRRLDLAAVLAAVEERSLRVEPAWTPVSIATLVPDPLASQAHWALDWVDRFAGETPYAKRHPAAPATWAQLQADLERLPDAVAQHPRIAITGSLRQATAFTAGAALRMVTGVDVAVAQRGVLWSSTAAYAAQESPAVTVHDVGQGSNVAISVEIATSITDDVLTYIREQKLLVDRLFVMTPPQGPKDSAVADASAANALAVGIRDQARRATRGADQAHLFLAGPMGLALLLGHRWNRVTASTVVYEDLAADGYAAAFTVAG